MKTIFKLLPLLLLASCASTPPIWKDEFGIVHREKVDPDEVAYVKVVTDANDIPGGCIRLRNIYLEGTMFKNWELQTETAKMFGTHVLKEYYNGVNDTLGIAYDCKNWRSISSKRRALKLFFRNQALGEMERRSYEKHKIEPKKNVLPVKKYEAYK